MKKRIISIVVLVGFLITGFIYLNKIFASNHHYVNTTEDFKKLAKKTNIDVILYGSSHAYTAYNPLIINDICKTISYNLGSDGLKISLTDLVLKESLKYTNPKLIILEVYPPSLLKVEGEVDKGYHLRAMDFVSNFSFLKLKKTIEIYDPNEYLGVYFPLIRNHDKWNSFNYFSFNKRKYLDFEKNFFYGGFLGSLNVMNDEDKKKYANFKAPPLTNDPSNKWVKEDAKNHIKEFVSIAKKNGSEVLIISSPDPRARPAFNYSFYQEIKDFSSTMNVPFLNLNDFYEEMNLTLDDFKDNSHLNTYGSIKATKFLANYLKSNYVLPNRTSEKIWKDEMVNYDIIKNEFYDIKIKSYSTVLNKNLSPDVVLNKLSIIRKNNRELLFNINFDSINTDVKNLDKYRLAVHIYSHDDSLALLNKSSKLKNAKYDQTNTILESGKAFTSFNIQTKIVNIKKVELFLFNKKGYDGIIGNKIMIDDISFKNLD